LTDTGVRIRRTTVAFTEDLREQAPKKSDYSPHDLYDPPVLTVRQSLKKATGEVTEGQRGSIPRTGRLSFRRTREGV